VGAGLVGRQKAPGGVVDPAGQGLADVLGAIEIKVEPSANGWV
jgi:hypothetical protein